MGEGRKLTASRLELIPNGGREEVNSFKAGANSEWGKGGGVGSRSKVGRKKAIKRVRNPNQRRIGLIVVLSYGVLNHKQSVKSQIKSSSTFMSYTV